jgi:hypothetical protein
MPNKTTTKPAPVDEADPRFVPVANALAKTPGVSLMESKSKGLRGMMLHGKSFGMSQRGRFILKLGEERVQALIEADVGKAFQMGAGPPMRGWIEVTDPDADWVALAKEAHALAAAAANSAPAKRSAAKNSASERPRVTKGLAKKSAKKSLAKRAR